MKKRGEHIFISYAHFDAVTAKDLIRRVEHHLQSSTVIARQFWIDRLILAGDDWDAQIKTALETADLGILLVSPAFLASEYINAVELPALIEKGCLAVGLKVIDAETQLHPMLKSVPLFRHAAPRAGLRSFSQCNSAQRENFALELYREILGHFPETQIAKTVES